MKRIVSVVVVLSLVASMAAVAGKKDGNAAPKAPKEPKVEAPLLDLTLAGKITKVQQQGKDGKNVDHYLLTTVASQVMELPIPHATKARKGEIAAPVINLDNYIDKTVSITAKGREVEKKGVKTTQIKEIVSIVIETPPADVPQAKVPPADAPPADVPPAKAPPADAPPAAQ